MKTILRWAPSVLLMVVIFALSSIPSKEMPSFGFWDTLVKKGGHMLGYGILTVSFGFGLGWERKRAWQAFLLAVAYALTDEVHQSFVPGRHASLLDALVFDGGGSILAMMGMWFFKKNGKN